MKHTEEELLQLKSGLKQMWLLVASQLEKTQQAFINFDVELAREVMQKEKRVDAWELAMHASCENYIALYNPVAIDLRLILSIIKIATTLERIADFADSIANYTTKQECQRLKLDTNFMNNLQINSMFDKLIGMLSSCFSAFDKENVKHAGKIVSQDDKIDEIYYNSITVLENKIKQDPDLARECLRMMTIMKKLERIGDHCSNIIEELVFYVDAKVLKHNENID